MTYGLLVQNTTVGPLGYCTRRGVDLGVAASIVVGNLNAVVDEPGEKFGLNTMHISFCSVMRAESHTTLLIYFSF